MTGGRASCTSTTFSSGVSIDGPRELHDSYRVDKGGKPTFDRVMRGLDRLKAHQVRWNVLTTVHHANEEHGLAVYRFLRDELGAEFIQFIPIVERPSPGGIPTGELVTDRSVSPAGDGQFLTQVFQEWARRDVGTVYVQMFDSTLASFLNVPGSLCVHSETLRHRARPGAQRGSRTRATTSWSRRTCWATSAIATCSSCCNLISSRPSEMPSATASRPTAGHATCVSPATEAAPRTASPRLLTASPACTTCVRAISTSFAASIDPCVSWRRN